MIELVTACNRCFVRQAPRAIPRPDGNRYREPYYSSTCHQTQGCCGEIVFTSEEALKAAREKGAEHGAPATCGEVEWCFNDGGPVENKVIRCRGCGHPVQVKQPQDAAKKEE